MAYWPRAAGVSATMRRGAPQRDRIALESCQHRNQVCGAANRASVSTAVMIDVKEILELHRLMVALWHDEPISQPYADFLGLVCRQHSFNFMLWHEEDIARSPDVSDSQIAAVKRAIDGYNQQRNDAIEKLDEWLAAQLHTQGVVPVAGARLNTETPGSAIDRLSIAALRIYHMEEQAARTSASLGHRAKARSRLEILLSPAARSGAVACRN